jgi:tripartite-type tricarboxylate transporter receptor subunit TctC
MAGRFGRRRALALAAPSIVLLSSTSRAQELPQGTIRVLIGFPAGGGTDVMGRIVVDRLRERTGRNFVVENRAGAAGALAGEALKSAAPDGSTVLLTPIGAAVMTRLTFRRPTFDPVADWAPIALLGTFQLVLAVANQLGVKTVAEFVAWVKANPKQASFGTTAVGSLPHFFGVMFGRAAGFEFQPVPYRGAAPLLQDLIGGQVPAGTAAFTDFYVHHQAGKLRIIASSGRQRVPGTDVPTFIESGYPEVEGDGWLGFFAPARTPRPIIDAFNREIVAAARDPAVKARLGELGLEGEPSTPEALAALQARDLAKWKPVVDSTGFRAD